MNMKALAILLAGALLTFAGTTLHANHLFAERSRVPDEVKGEIIAFKVKRADRTAYITRSDQLQHWSILGAGILLFLLGAKGGALKRNRALP